MMRKSHPLMRGLEEVTPYRVTTSDDLYEVSAPPEQIEGFMTMGTVVGMTSNPGVGKTWLAMEIARAGCTGSPFLGKMFTHRTNVLFVGSDSSEADYARQWTRLTRWRTQYVDPVGLPVDTYDEVIDFLIQADFILDSVDDIRRLIRTAQRRQHGYGIIILDTLSRLTRANQNDNTAMEEVFRNVRWLSEATGAAVVLLHHNSKKSEFNDGEDWRGAMSGIGALDAWVHLTPSKTTRGVVGVSFKKYRGITPPDFAYTMHVSDPAKAWLEMSDEAVTREQKLTTGPLVDGVLNYVKDAPWSRASDIFKAVSPSMLGEDKEFTVPAKLRAAVNNRLAHLLASEKLQREISREGKPIFALPGVEKPE